MKPFSTTIAWSQKMIRRATVFGALLPLLISAWPALAQGSERAVQEIIDTMPPEGGFLYLLSDLQAGDRLFVYAEGLTGNMDPITIVAEGDADGPQLRAEFFGRIRDAVEQGEDPLVAAQEVGDDLFLDWDDDSGDGYASALEFLVPADGDYQLALASTFVDDTFGDFRILVGLNEPQVLSGRATPTGDIIAVLDRTGSSGSVFVQELTGALSEERRSTFFELDRIDQGETLYAFVESTSGDLKPIIFLEDFGGKPIRAGNFTGRASEGSIEYTFGDSASNFRLVIEACCEDETTTTGDFRLLVGVNEPDVLTGRAATTSETIVRQPRRVQIGIDMDQITSVDQRAENFSVVANLTMRWQDPALAFSPDTCDCDFKTFTGPDFVDFANENEIRWPEFTLLNQQGNRWTQNEIVVVRPNGEALFLERFSATLQAPDFDFRRFPFDSQQFFIRVLSLFPEEFIVFVDREGSSQVGEQLGEEEWTVTESTVFIDTQDQRSEYVFGFRAERHLTFYLFRFFLPILIIIVVSWITFFLKDYGRRVEVASANLLLFIAFNFTISGDLPKLGYLTFFDTILVSTFMITGLVVVFNVILKRLEVTGKEELAHRLDKYTVWLYPVSYFVAFLVVTRLFT